MSLSYLNPFERGFKQMKKINVVLEKEYDEPTHQSSASTKNKLKKDKANNSAVEVMTDWIKRNKNSDIDSLTDKNYRPYRKCEKATKAFIHGQTLYLLNKGLGFTETSKILSIHRSTASNWWQHHLNNNNKLDPNEMLNKAFKNLSPEIKAVLTTQLIKLKEEGKTHKSIADTLGLANSSSVSKLLHEYKESLPIIKPIPLSNTKVQLLSPSSSLSDTAPKAYTQGTTSTKNQNIAETIPSKFVSLPCSSLGTKVKGEPSQEGLTSKNLGLKTIISDESDLVKEKSPVLNKLKKLIGLTEKEDHSQCERENKNQTSPFYLVDPESLIQLKSDTKIIKEKDYAYYCESSDLLQASKEHLENSKKYVATLEKEAIKSANIKAEIIIEKAKEDGKREADNLLAEKSIEATKASIDYLASLEDSLPNLIISIVRKIINDYDDQEFVIQNIASAVKNLSDNEEIKIHVSSSIINNVNTHLSGTTYAGRITLIPDSSLNDKDCLIVTKLGIINACLDTQLQKIESDMIAPAQEAGHHITVEF